MKQPFLPYAKQNISSADHQAVQEALSAPRITRGDRVVAFEREVAAMCDAAYAVAFMNATAALFAAMHVIQAAPQDRLFVPTNTFIATAGCGISKQLQPRFVDIERTSGNMSLEHLKSLVRGCYSRGKTIVVPVHFAGIAVDMVQLEEIFQEENLVIIEDAAHAIGSSYPTGEKVGSCHKSQMTIFSFHPAKTMTSGEGGMVTTNSEELYHALCRFRNNGIEREEKYLVRGHQGPGYYEVQEITGNFHMTELQAALGLSQLARLHEFVEKRRKLVACYRRMLAGEPFIRLFSEEYDHRTAYHLMVVQIDFAKLGISRDVVVQQLLEEGIGTEVHYIPLYRHPIFYHPDIERDFPESESYYQEALSLPLYYDLTEEDVTRVCVAVKRICRAYA